MIASERSHQDLSQLRLFHAQRKKVTKPSLLKEKTRLNYSVSSHNRRLYDDCCTIVVQSLYNRTIVIQSYNRRFYDCTIVQRFLPENQWWSPKWSALIPLELLATLLQDSVSLLFFLCVLWVFREPSKLRANNLPDIKLGGVTPPRFQKRPFPVETLPALDNSTQVPPNISSVLPSDMENYPVQVAVDYYL